MTRKKSVEQMRPCNQFILTALGGRMIAPAATVVRKKEFCFPLEKSHFFPLSDDSLLLLFHFAYNKF
jgi:hypothetical protein